ncbi:hypothetical protein ACIOGZ_28350 [Kitasatospora sp. NPDC088160]|uniref:hypothetical protein n=1 Tax=Kitasatospora sp. NPDC088160 TaxID=3364072 RepID=UPI003816723F
MAARDLSRDEAEAVGLDFAAPSAGASRHIDIGTMANGYPSHLVTVQVDGGWIWHSGERTVLCDSEAEAQELFDRDLVELVWERADPFEEGGRAFRWEAGDVLIATVAYEEYGEGTYCVSRIAGEVEWSTHDSREEAIEAALDLAADLPDGAVSAEGLAALARYATEARIYLALCVGQGLDDFCERFEPAEDDIWFPEEHLGLAMARVGTWWVVATNDSVNDNYLAFSLHEDEDEARAVLAGGVAAYYRLAEDVAYDWVSFDRAAIVRVAPLTEDSDTYAVAAVLGERESVLLTVDSRSQAIRRAAEILAAYAAQVSPVTEADGTEAVIRYQALRRRVLQDTVAALAGCEADLGDAIRRAEEEGLYGRGRDLTWVQVAHRLDVHRDTLQEIRKGTTWTA